MSEMEKKSIHGLKTSQKMKMLLYVGLGVVALIIVITLGSVISQPLERLISVAENLYQKWFEKQNTANPFVLLPLAFIGLSNECKARFIPQKTIVYLCTNSKCL